MQLIMFLNKKKLNKLKKLYYYLDFTNDRSEAWVKKVAEAIVEKYKKNKGEQSIKYNKYKNKINNENYENNLVMSNRMNSNSFNKVKNDKILEKERLKKLVIDALKYKIDKKKNAKNANNYEDDSVVHQIVRNPNINKFNDITNRHALELKEIPSIEVYHEDETIPKKESYKTVAVRNGYKNDDLDKANTKLIADRFGKYDSNTYDKTFPEIHSDDDFVKQIKTDTEKYDKTDLTNKKGQYETANKNLKPNNQNNNDLNDEKVSYVSSNKDINSVKVKSLSSKTKYTKYNKKETKKEKSSLTSNRNKQGFLDNEIENYDKAIPNHDEQFDEYPVLNEINDEQQTLNKKGKIDPHKNSHLSVNVNFIQSKTKKNEEDYTNRNRRAVSIKLNLLINHIIYNNLFMLFQIGTPISDNGDDLVHEDQGNIEFTEY